MKMISVRYTVGAQFFHALCYYPEGISTPGEFAAMLKTAKSDFIALDFPKGDNCVHPYYIEEDIMCFYLNPSYIVSFWESEATILPRAEYETRLREVVGTLCVTCKDYIEDGGGISLDGHWQKVCLDGTCEKYEKKDDEWGEEVVKA